jgi:hypothetical protein
MTERPPAPAAPAAPKPTATVAASPRSTIPEAVALEWSRGKIARPSRVVVYGPGGVGKSTLCSYAPAPAFLDLERGTGELEVTRDEPSSWLDLRGKLARLQTAELGGLRTLVIDSATIAEKMACDHVIATRPADKHGTKANSIESYSWGKGWGYVAEEFDALLADLDRLVARGLNVILIAHAIDARTPNPEGEDWLRWEPSLYPGTSRGVGNIRNAVVQWADHVAFVTFDVSVSSGKASGVGTRTVHTLELPTHVAKSRRRGGSWPFTFDEPGKLWTELGLS